MRTPAGVLFDMDGLLLDTERVHLEVGHTLGHELGLGDLTAVLRSMIGIRHQEGRLLLEPVLGNALSLETFERHWHEGIDARLAESVPVKPGARELLERLAGSGIPCAVATSTRRSIAIELLERAGLLEYLRTVTGGDDVAHAKPDPEIYHRAAASLRIVAIDAVAFEDSNLGTRAAVASGATTVQVPDLLDPDEEVIALGHVIATDLLSGAARIGLLTDDPA